MVAQLQSLTIDETLLNETCHRVSRTINDKGDAIRKELSLLNESLVNLERAIEAFAIPTGDDAREVKRLESLASLTEQQTRDLRRRNELQDQLAKIQAGTPDRQTILKAIKNLARVAGITRARVTQIINLTNLAPDIQQAILDLEPTTDHVPRFRDREVRAIAITANWDMQRVLWKRLFKRTAESKSSEL